LIFTPSSPSGERLKVPIPVIPVPLRKPIPPWIVPLLTFVLPPPSFISLPLKRLLMPSDWLSIPCKAGSPTTPSKFTQTDHRFLSSPPSLSASQITGFPPFHVREHQFWVRIPLILGLSRCSSPPGIALDPLAHFLHYPPRFYLNP